MRTTPTSHHPVPVRPLPRRLLLAAAILLTPLSGCGSSSEPAPSAVAAASPSAAPATMTVTSTAFKEGGTIPSEHTCTGAGTLPPIRWSGAGTGVKAIAVVVDDPDAPDDAYVHWIVTDLPPDTTTVDPEKLPATAKEAANSGGGPGWTPPCPPGGVHHYRFTVHALDAPTGIAANAPAFAGREAIDRHTIAYGRLTGTVDGG